MPIPFHYNLLSGAIVEMPNAWQCPALSPLKRRLIFVGLSLVFLLVIGFLVYSAATASTECPQQVLKSPAVITATGTTSIVEAPKETVPNPTTAHDGSTTHSSDFYPVRLITFENRLLALLEAQAHSPSDVSTIEPLPLDPYITSAVTLLLETLSEVPTFHEIPCADQIPIVYQVMVEIERKNYTGQASIDKNKAKEYAAQQAALALWDLQYHEPDSVPHSCIPNTEVVELE